MKEKIILVNATFLTRLRIQYFHSPDSLENDFRRDDFVKEEHPGKEEFLHYNSR